MNAPADMPAPSRGGQLRAIFNRTWARCAAGGNRGACACPLQTSKGALVAPQASVGSSRIGEFVA
jgi:hypothetical protein